MKKITIIHGLPATGKSRCAEIIMECSGLNYQIGYSILLKNTFNFIMLSRNTNGLIIDDIRNVSQLKFALEYFKNEYIKVHRHSKEPIKIKLKKIILVCDFTITNKMHFDEKYNYINI